MEVEIIKGKVHGETATEETMQFLLNHLNFRGGGYGGDKPVMRSNYTRREEDVETLWKNNSSTGINFSTAFRYDRIPVHVEGENKPRQAS